MVTPHSAPASGVTLGKVTPPRHPQGTPGRLCCLSLSHSHWGSSRASQILLIGATAHSKADPKPQKWHCSFSRADPKSLLTPKPGLELPQSRSQIPAHPKNGTGASPSPSSLQELLYEAFPPQNPVNWSCLQRWEAPGSDAEGAVPVPHRSQPWGPRGAARAPRQGHPPSLGAGIIIPTVWEWLQGHETAQGRPGACSNSATLHTTRPLCPQDSGGQSKGAAPSPPAMDSGPAGSSHIQRLSP